MVIPFNNLASALAEIRSDIDAAVKRVVDSGVFLGGEEVAAFEEEWAKYCGAKYCVACASGTDAVMFAADATIGGVRIQANGCKFTHIALEREDEHGIIFVDVDEHGMMLNRSDCDTFGLPTLLYGRFECQPSPVVDACQAHGWKPTTDAAWSFYPTKNLGSFGDSGAVTTNSEGVERFVRVQAALWHSRMSELNAAILRTKLPHLDRWNAERAEIAAVYYNGLPEWAEPACRPGEPTNHHIFAVLVERRDELEVHLRERGVGTRVHYREPLAELPGARRWANMTLSLPMWPGLKAEQVREVCDCIRGFK